MVRAARPRVRTLITALGALVTLGPPAARAQNFPEACTRATEQYAAGRADA